MDPTYSHPSCRDPKEVPLVLGIPRSMQRASAHLHCGCAGSEQGLQALMARSASSADVL